MVTSQSVVRTCVGAVVCLVLCVRRKLVSILSIHIPGLGWHAIVRRRVMGDRHCLRAEQTRPERDVTEVMPMHGCANGSMRTSHA